MSCERICGACVRCTIHACGGCVIYCLFSISAMMGGLKLVSTCAAWVLYEICATKTNIAWSRSQTCATVERNDLPSMSAPLSFLKSCCSWVKINLQWQSIFCGPAGDFKVECFQQRCKRHPFSAYAGQNHTKMCLNILHVQFSTSWLNSSLLRYLHTRLACAWFIHANDSWIEVQSIPPAHTVCTYHEISRSSPSCMNLAPR